DLYNIPVDVVPSVPETAADNFSSNSMLAVGADLYVLNRGNNSIVRITQRGRLVAKRYIHVDGQIGFRAAGLAVSPDGQTIWVTGQTKNRGGIVVKIPAFGSGPIMSSLMSQAKMQGASTLNSLGEFFFTKSFSIAEGVGPLFNAQSCVACHGEPKTGGMSATNFVALVDGAHGPVARAHSITELGAECSLQTGPVGATVVSLRSSMSLRNTSLIDFVQPHDIILGAAAQPVDVRGRVNYTADGRVGRFGWKANVPTLIEFMGDGFRNEMGLTNGLHRTDLASGCGSDRVRPELDAVPLVTTAAFLATVDAPAPNASCTSSHGATVFKNTGCTSCHRPSFPGPGGVPAVLYSDLLLHDMGAALADGLAQESATGAEFRTMTLVAMSERSHYLHDGRAKTLQDAILMHGGQATASKNAYQGLSAADQGALTAFLGCL
ncbi:MAG: hypothetical protein OEW08_11780, partial [Gammaproteobacteria bacterium]|nr:hypothetical protein [Gammaproteobacteria bacterium]